MDVRVYLPDGQILQVTYVRFVGHGKKSLTMVAGHGYIACMTSPGSP